MCDEELLVSDQVCWEQVRAFLNFLKAEWSHPLQEVVSCRDVWPETAWANVVGLQAGSPWFNHFA